MDRLRKGLSVEDQKIVDRLEQLHRDRKASEQMPSDKEMADRLAKLKGVPQQPQQQGGGAFYVRPDTRVDAARTEDLLRQMGEEVRMDETTGAAADPTDEIAERLAKLKGVAKEHVAAPKEVLPEEEEELPSDEEADKLVRQLMEEQKLEEGQKKERDEEMEEETPPPIDNKYERSIWASKLSSNLTIRMFISSE